MKYTPLHEIPDFFTEVTVSDVIPSWRTPPVGYDPALRPLAKVSYTSYANERVANVIVSYEAVRRRFPRDLNRLFMGCTRLISKE